MSTTELQDSFITCHMLNGVKILKGISIGQLNQTRDLLGPSEGYYIALKRLPYYSTRENGVANIAHSTDSWLV